MADYFEEIARDLRRYRQMRGLRQQDVAESVGTTQASITDFERGNRLPRRGTLGKLVRLVEQWRAEAGASVREIHGPYAPNAQTGRVVSLSFVCPYCGALVPEPKLGYYYCGGCGKQLMRPCSACGEPNAMDARFCSACGKELEDGSRGK